MSDLLPKYGILVKQNRNDWWILERCTESKCIANFWRFIYSFKYNFVEIREHRKRNL